LLVCPARPELLERRRTWGAGRPNATALTVPPLPPEGAAELVRALLDGARISDALRDRILGRAEGNPFFLEETLRMLLEQGAIAGGEGREGALGDVEDVPLPDTVHGVIAARLDLLEQPQREALRRCAVVGNVFWPGAVDVDEDVVGLLARHGLVSE